MLVILGTISGAWGLSLHVPDKRLTPADLPRPRGFFSLGLLLLGLTPGFVLKAYSSFWAQESLPVDLGDQTGHQGSFLS